MSKDSISTKQDLDDFNEVTAQFVNYFLYNRSFKMGCDIQNSRCGTQLFEINSSEFTTVIESEDFEGRGVTGNKDEPFIYFRVPEKIIFNDERLDALFIKQNFLGKVIDIKTLNKYIDRTIDIFFVGKKIPSDEISMVLMERYFIIKLPKKYDQFNGNLYLVSRYYFKDFIVRGNILNYDNSFLEGLDNAEYDSIVFINGKLSLINSHYTEQVNGTKVRLTAIDPELDTLTKDQLDNIPFEILFIKNLNNYNKIELHNGYLEIEGRFIAPIPTNNIYLFNNRYFTRLGITQVSGNIYKCNNIDTENLRLYYYYDKEAYADDSYMYYDHFQWFWDEYKPKVYNWILQPHNLPNMISKFKLFTTEISCRDYEYILENDNVYLNLKNYNDYLYESTRKMIKYDAELLQTYYSMLCNKFKNYENKRTSVFIPKKSSDRDYFLRKDTKDVTKDDISMTKVFHCNCLKFEYPNPNNHILLLYLNGVKFNDYSYMMNINGTEYIYIEAENLPEEECTLTIEELDTINREEIVVNRTPSDEYTINFTENAGKFHKEDLRYIKIYKIENSGGVDKITELTNKPKYIEINHTNQTYDNITIKFDKEIDRYSTYRIVNENFYSISRYRSKINGKDLTIYTDNNFRYTKRTEFDNIKDYFRVYRNGRLLPRNAYTISGNSPLEYMVSITNDSNYNKLELFEVEYVPNREIELFYIEDINWVSAYDFISRLTMNKNQNGLYYELLALLIENIVVVSNGRYLEQHTTDAMFQIWSTKGLTIHRTHARYNLSIITKYNPTIYEFIKYVLFDYNNINTKKENYYGEFKNSLMVGGPLYDDEVDCRKPTEYKDKLREMWYDLYMEFLKHNLIDEASPMPEYIAFKYGALINDEGTRIDVEMDNTDHLYWMPLDSTIDYSSEEFLKFQELYYQLLKDLQNFEILYGDEIPDELYEKYKDLFDNNTLLIQLPDYYKFE